MTAKLPKDFTQGTVLRWRKTSGLVLAEVAYDPGQRIHRETNQHARFVLVLSGSLTEQCDGDTVTHPPSTLLFRRASEPRSYAVATRGARCLVVDIDDAWLGRARQEAPLLNRSTAFRRGLLLHLAHRLYGEFRQRDEVSRLAVESLTLGVLAEASRRAESAAQQRVPVWLLLAMALIEERFREPLPLAAVAKAVGVHPVHLARTFRRVHQTTVAAYVRQLRIDFARSQLVGPAGLSEIAYAAGFCDQSHFSRCFKRHTGLTPAEYRANLR
ncbi:MAG TPA: AraC family transcriptional regulator [Vicinamibacterales bacterium]|nr:AraC family transcriptional regulator [Vicinamibacterales bacterium]